MSDEGEEEDPFDLLGGEVPTDGDPFDDFTADEIKREDIDIFAEVGGDQSSDPENRTEEGQRSTTETGSDTGSRRSVGYDVDSGLSNGSDTEYPAGFDGSNSGRSGDARSDRGNPFESPESPFHDVEADTADADEIWRQLTDEGEDDAEDGDTNVGPGDADEESETVTVSKREFCQECPHFSSPPNSTCNYAGARIEKFVGMDRVQVVNCPIVQRRRELGEFDS